jgi:hypothetical protein
MVEEILQGWTEQVDDEDVVKALLAKVINIRDAGLRGRFISRCPDRVLGSTHGIRRGSCRFGIHHAVEERHSYVVPTHKSSSVNGFHGKVEVWRGELLWLLRG